MSSGGVEVTILAEDEPQRMFIRKHLRKRGYTYHKIRELHCPAYETPGLSFIKSTYLKEVEALRARSHRVTNALIVVVDADNLIAEERLRWLDDLLADAGQERRRANEPVICVVPRRNIETWMFFLDGNAVDEETDYKPRCRSFDNGEFALKFANLTWPRGQLPDNCPPSLKHACQVELPRLP